MAYIYVHRSMPYLSKEEIEDRTLQLLAEYEKANGLLQPPIPIDHITEGFCQLIFDWDLIEDSEDCPILARLDPSSKTITMNEVRRGFFDTYFGSEAFTKAHELGHWKLHIFESDYRQLSFDFSGANVFLCRSIQNNRLEIQANAFASSLLMPKAKLTEAFYKMDIVSWPNIYKLASAFGVSKTAMKNRLIDLNLIRLHGNEVLPTSAGQRRVF